jgi:hypothetical protein
MRKKKRKTAVCISCLLMRFVESQIAPEKVVERAK